MLKTLDFFQKVRSKIEKKGLITTQNFDKIYQIKFILNSFIHRVLFFFNRETFHQLEHFFKIRTAIIF